MIDVERVNSTRMWMDNDKAQRQKFETLIILNGRLRLWHWRGRNDSQVIEIAYNKWINGKDRRMSYKWALAMWLCNVMYECLDLNACASVLSANVGFK